MAAATKKEMVIKHNIYMPSDVALLILSKLPIKSLNRFRGVQKSWLNLLENPRFKQMYMQNYLFKDDDGSSLLVRQQTSEELPNPILVSGERFEKKVELDLPSPCHEEDVISIKFLDSCDNGTIGVVRYKRRHGDKDVMLWNPATKEFKIIPSAQVLGTAFWVHIHGFGYDIVNDDFKLLQHATCFVDHSQDIEEFWQIYSLKRNSWKKLDLNMTYASVRWKPFGSAVNLNGSLHWWGTNRHDKGTVEEDVLVSFDMSNEVFHTTPIGWRTNFEYVNRYLTVFNGSIAMISNSFGSNYLDISILGEFGVRESWTKLFTIGPLPSFGRPIGVGKKGDILFIKDLEDSELGCFDLSTQMSKEISIRGPNYNSKIVFYKESFLHFGEIN